MYYVSRSKPFIRYMSKSKSRGSLAIGKRSKWYYKLENENKFKNIQFFVVIFSLQFLQSNDLISAIDVSS